MLKGNSKPFTAPELPEGVSLHIDWFMPRGRAAAQSEWRLIAATHNLLELHGHWIASTA